jgi:hypothetical protein
MLKGGVPAIFAEKTAELFNTADWCGLIRITLGGTQVMQFILASMNSTRSPVLPEKKSALVTTK